MRDVFAGKAFFDAWTDGRNAIAGHQQQDVYLHRLSLAPAALWMSQGKAYQGADALGMSPGGSRLFVTGWRYGNYATVAYDAASGAQLWASRYNGGGAYALGVSSDGSKVFVTGRSSGGDSDYATVAYDAASGAQLWARRYNGPGNGNDYAHALGVSPDGSKVFVTGQSIGSGGYPDYATVAYDAASGAQLWVTRYDGPANSFDYAYALGVSPDSSKVFVTGTSNASDGSSDYATVAYDAASGAQLWASRYNGPSNSGDGANALGVSPDGSKVFVTGGSAGFVCCSGVDYATVAYDAASGAQLWVSRYDAGFSDVASALAMSLDGSRVFVTGQSIGAGNGSYSDYATVSYDAASGAQLWASHYSGDGDSYSDSYPHALGASPDGSKVFVTGQTTGSRGYDDYATVAYNAASGAQQWASRYDGPGGYYDYAYALGVSPDSSKLFVTGQGATIAYPAG